jgi:tetratricopeptide (TPR) repeat protein
MAYLETQDLDNVELQIDLPDEGGESPRLLHILKATFDLGALEQHEQYYLMFFAQLPAQETDIQDLIDWYGPRKLAENKREMTNIINKLHSRGLIERNAGQIHMHRMLQQAIFYQERQSERPFQSQFMHIPELIKRIHEGADHDINQALRFLKYGEAYLVNIKENYRVYVYLAMLQLENEVLNIYNWLYTQDDMVAKWDSLYDRAQKVLPAEHSLMGVIANNYGLALVTEGNLEKAISLFDKASVVMAAQSEKAIPQLLISLSNLCHLFVKRGEMEHFHECFDKIREIREKHKLYNDISLPIQTGVLGIAYKKYGNLERAMEMFNFAINLHLELPKEKRNDLHLINYLISRTECCLQMNQLEKAEKSVTAAVSVLSKIQSQDTIYLREVTKLLIVICDIKGDHDQSNQLRLTLENMGYYEAD